MFDPEPLLADGQQARREDRVEEARDLFAQAVAESRFLADPALLIRSLRSLAQTERDLRHPDTAIKCYREAAQLQRKHGDELGWAHSVRHIADILRGQKKLAEAEAAYLEALAVYSSHLDRLPLDHANALRGLAVLKDLTLDKTGETEEVLLLWRAAKSLYQTAGVEAGIAECASHIAFLLHS